MGDGINFTKEALLRPLNLLAMLGSGIATLVTGEPGWLMLGAGAELVYLGTIPGWPRFQRLVRSRKNRGSTEESDGKGTDDLIRELGQDGQKRYFALARLRKVIGDNFRTYHRATRSLLEAQVSKLDTLLLSYLRMLHAQEGYRLYLAKTDANSIRTDLEAVRSSLEASSERVRGINRQRVEILEKRLSEWDKVQEHVSVMDAQLAAIEDMFKYMHEQSMTMRDPQELSFQLDSLMTDVETSEQVVRDIETTLSNSPSALLGLDDPLRDGFTGALDPTRAPGNRRVRD